MEVQSVVGVPGLWKSHSELVKAIAHQRWIFAGKIMIDPATQQTWGVDLYEHDPDMRKAFKIAGMGHIDDSLLDEIDRHTFTAYLSAAGGSAQSARDTMKAVSAVLRAGGLAAKVESAGLAHSAEVWQALTEVADSDPGALYAAYVNRVGSGDPMRFFTCGMHNLGLRDVIIEDEYLPPKAAAKLLSQFAQYTLYEQPELATGHTFSLNADSPVYTLTAEPCTLYPEDDLFYNPFGMWRLSYARYSL